MYANQLALLKNYNLCITHISTVYNLNICIDLNIFKNAHSKAVYKTHTSTVMIKDEKRYQIDVYPDGKLIIHRETNLTSIITLIQDFIKQFNIPYNNTLDVKNISIVGLRCAGTLLYDININMIPHNLCIK